MVLVMMLNTTVTFCVACTFLCTPYHTSLSLQVMRAQGQKLEVKLDKLKGAKASTVWVKCDVQLKKWRKLPLLSDSDGSESSESSEDDGRESVHVGVLFGLQGFNSSRTLIRPHKVSLAQPRTPLRLALSTLLMRIIINTIVIQVWVVSHCVWGRKGEIEKKQIQKIESTMAHVTHCTTQTTTTSTTIEI